MGRTFDLSGVTSPAVPDLSHLWQRFLLASSLLFGLVIGVVATVFGYSNATSVEVRWSVFHLAGVPLWTVAVVPLAVVLVAGTLYHWFNSLHHFTEHMRHRRRVHEAEVATLRSHLDHVLEMPDHSTSRLSARHVIAEPAQAEAPAEVVAPAVSAPAASEPAVSNGASKTTRRALPRRKVEVDAESEPQLVAPAAETSAVAEPEVAKEPEPAADPVEA